MSYLPVTERLLNASLDLIGEIVHVLFAGLGDYLVTGLKELIRQVDRERCSRDSQQLRQTLRVRVAWACDNRGCSSHTRNGGLGDSRPDGLRRDLRELVPYRDAELIDGCGIVDLGEGHFPDGTDETLEQRPSQRMTLRQRRDLHPELRAVLADASQDETVPLPLDGEGPGARGSAHRGPRFRSTSRRS